MVPQVQYRLPLRYLLRGFSNKIQCNQRNTLPIGRYLKMNVAKLRIGLALSLL